jgi:hypothetical protein
VPCRRAAPALRALAATAALVLALASPAFARPGWQIKRLLSGTTFKGTGAAIHCGASKLGTYTWRTKLRYTSGRFKGKTLTEVVTVRLLDDHKRHAFHLVSVGGSAVKSLTAAQQRELERRLAAGFKKLEIEVLRLDGQQLTVAVWDHGKPKGTGRVMLDPASC